MNRVKILIPMLLVLAVATTAAAQQNPCNPCGGNKKVMETADNPCGGKAMADNPCGGKAMSHAMPAVNPCHAKMGAVFYLSDPMARNTVTFTSEAPLEDIIGTTNDLGGYVVFDPKKPQQGGRGHITVPVSSLTTGIPLRDEHLHGPMWLDAAAHPEISFFIEDVSQVEVVKQTDAFTTFKMVLIGPFTLNGHSERKYVAATVTYMAESDKTRQRSPGNLLAGRARLAIDLDEFGIEGMKDVVGSKVSESIDVDISFVASSATGDMAGNPCNPCGGKAKVAGNPCGGKAGL